MIDSDLWLLIAGPAVALLLMGLSALAKGVAHQKSPHGIVAWPHRREEDFLQEQRSDVMLWLLNAVGIAGGTLLITWWLYVKGEQAFLAGALAVWFLLALVVGHALPLGLGEKHADHLVRGLRAIFRPLSLILYPLTWLSIKVSQVAGFSADKPRYPDGQLTDDDLRALAHIAGAQDGTIEEDEREMIAGVFQLGNALAREVMVPRPDIVAVDADTPMLEALTTVISAGHSRIPVYRDNIDNIIGILYAKDLLSYLRDGETNVPLEQTLRKAYFVPESKAADDLLQELQQRRTHIAIVVDEYGGVAGLVTIEDLLEEIVGEIRDEYDTAEEPLIEAVSPYEVICNARIDLDDLNRQLSLSLPTKESDTLGGLIYSRLGRIPEIGDKIEVDGVEVTVLSIDGQRITKVRLTLSQPQVEPPDSSSSEPSSNLRQTLLENVSNPLAFILHILL